MSAYTTGHIGKPAHSFCRCGHRFYHWALRSWVEVQADGASVLIDASDHRSCFTGRGPEHRK